MLKADIKIHTNPDGLTPTEYSEDQNIPDSSFCLFLPGAKQTRTSFILLPTIMLLQQRKVTSIIKKSNK